MYIWRNKQARSTLFQVIAMVTLVVALAFFGYNANQNLETSGKGFSYDFVHLPANYDIHQTLIDYDLNSSHARALLVGLLNTLLVAFFGIIFATLMGFVIGVMRLSSNYLISRISAVYIEVVRNVPVLLQILLIHGVVVNLFPLPKSAWDVGLDIFLTNRGMFMPKPIFEEGSGLIGLALVVGIAVAWGYTRYARRVQAETGKILPAFTIGLSAIVLLPTLAYFVAGQPVSFDIPTAGKFNLKGGMTLLPEFVSLLLALSIYTAAFIAENVRSGILAINKGQTEAALALGLRPNRVMRLVIIPQALRVIIPPLTSQHLNLTKNTSLAIGIGYMDLMGSWGGITMNQTGRAMETMLVALLIYLSVSLSISLLMNWYNSRIKLIER